MRAIRENTFNEDYDNASTMSIDTDNSSSDNSFQTTSIKIGKATNIQLDNLEDDMSEYNDDNESYINEEDDDTNSMPVAGDTDDEDELDDEDDIYGDVNYPKPPEMGDDDEEEDDMDYVIEPQEQRKS